MLGFKKMNFKWCHDLFKYFREILNWLFDARLGFLCCFVLILAFLTSFYTWPSEKSIRTTGYVLQLLGMIFAIRGVLKIREHFGQPTIKCMLSSWLSKFPKWRKHGYFEAPSVHIGVTVGTGSIEVWAPDNPNDPVEKRLEAVLHNINSLKENQRNHFAKVLKIEKEHKKFKEDQIEKIESVKSELITELEQAHTNDILVSLVGLIWLTFGITLSTLPYEIFQLIK
ncbi:hypothetical protein [Desulfuromonas thiophila]|uniref:hypothetical protein n=1 Tax=Desulfuromonas thiophila TaxID=57664 RepID=UPI0024A7EE83|nr:hypothetical protein [Desulfuromonas thiophila]